MNLFAYCGNNPVNRVDPTGEAWWHWVLGAAVVGACAAATIITCGGFAAAAVAIGAVGSGFAAATTASTVAAAAFIGSSVTLTGTAAVAALTSSSAQQFADQGNWGTVATVASAAALSGASAFLDTRGSSPSTKSVPNPNGKRGGAAHQAEIARQVSINSKPGFTVDTEVKILTPGGMKPYRYADFSVTDNVTGNVWYGNVGRQLQSGLPCARERYAISDIQSTGAAIHFFPYN